MVLEKAKTVSTLAFLRSLQAAKGCINTLVDGLKTHGLTGHPEPASLQISLTLDQQVDELFVPYLVGTSSIEREKRSLEELYSSLLFKFTIYHVGVFWGAGGPRAAPARVKALQLSGEKRPPANGKGRSSLERRRSRRRSWRRWPSQAARSSRRHEMRTSNGWTHPI